MADIFNKEALDALDDHSEDRSVEVVKSILASHPEITSRHIVNDKNLCVRSLETFFVGIFFSLNSSLHFLVIADFFPVEDFLFKDEREIAALTVVALYFKMTSH